MNRHNLSRELRSELAANQALAATRRFRYAPPAPQVRPLSWLSRLVIALCGF